VISSGTSRQFHKIIPVPRLFFAAAPVFSTVMENWLSYVIIAPLQLIGLIFFGASFVYTFMFSILGNEDSLRLLFNLSLFLLHFLIKIIDFQNLRLLFLFRDLFRTPIVSKELILVNGIVGLGRVFSDSTGGDGLKLIPVVDNLVTAGPPLL
jgi:hypothetical protein